ncbi:MAG: hypothetical protein QXF23_01070 [Candidatus Bathyarchaeia archaeon]
MDINGHVKVIAITFTAVTSLIVNYPITLISGESFIELWVNLVRIIISKYGRISDEELSQIINIIEECYARLMPHEVSLIDLYIFESFSLAEPFTMKEYASLGVSATPYLEENFFAMHDAWRGIPRITLFLDRLRVLPEVVKVGGIRHEVGHTVLHGSLEYYLLALPAPLIRAIEEFNLPLEYAKNILYLVSIAVKDYEVTRLLYSRGYISDQVEYVRFLLKDNEEETFSWRLSSWNSLLEALHLVSLLKVLGCAAPLLADEKFGNDIRAEITRYLSYLPEDLSRTLIEIVEENFARLGDDTIQNINSMVENCIIMILSKFFRGR